jgi:hypothetical protein
MIPTAQASSSLTNAYISLNFPYLITMQERDAKKKIEDEKRKEEEAKKAKRRVAYQERKKQEDEKRRVANEQKKFFSEKRKSKEMELRAQGLWKEKTPLPVSMPVMHKRGPGRPPKAETMARMQAQCFQQQQHHPAEDGQPIKRGRGRPRKDGGAPIPRKLPIKSEISMANLYFDNSDSNVERSRSGRKIQRTVFHDEMEGGGLMKRPRSDEHGGVAASASRQASMYLAERSAAAAVKNVLTPASSKKEPRRKPGARECMQMSRKFSTTVIDQKYFDVLMVRPASPKLHFCEMCFSLKIFFVTHRNSRITQKELKLITLSA